MRLLIEPERDKLMTQGILMPVQHADWAATIVPIMKADRCYLCNDLLTVLLEYT